jgi:hypothetical protein
MVSIVPGTFTGVSNAAELSDGQLACTDFSRRESSNVIQTSLGQRSLSAFQSYVVGEFAAEYLCSKQLPQALGALRSALVAGS